MRWWKALVRAACASVLVAGVAVPGNPASGPSTPAAVAQSDAAYRVYVAQAAKTLTPTGARCNDQVYRDYTGPNTCAGHGGIHYWIYS